MSVTDKKILVGFKRVDDCLLLLCNALKESAELVNFEYLDEVKSLIEGMIKGFPPLLYAQVLESLEICLGDETIKILFDYYPDPLEDDDLDMSLLKLLSLKPERLGFNIILNDEGCARCVGVERLPGLSTEHIEVVVIAKDKETGNESERSNNGEN